MVRHVLHLQCRVADGCLRAVVLTREADGGPFRLVTTWPNDAPTTSALRNAATAAIRNRRTAIMASERSSDPAAGFIVACPVLHEDTVLGVVAVEFGGSAESRRRAVARAFETCAAALMPMLRATGAEPDPQARRILDIVAASVEHVAFDAASRSAMSRLAATGQYEQVTLGFVSRGRSSICAASGRANVDSRMRVARNMGLAMDEAIAQDATLVYAGNKRDRDHALDAHAELVAARGGGALCTIPINRDDRLVGAVLIEHADAQHFDAATTAFCETAVALIGPILFDKHRQDRGPVGKLISAAAAAANGIRAPQNRWRWVAAAIVAGVLAVPFIASGQYRVTSNASLEGATRRIVASPVDGFVAEAPARAGDIVEAGQLLARLDDRDLKLERLKWSSEKEQLRREYREAMAEHDSSRVTILKARLDRATAQLGLTEERIARAHIIAPMAGVVVAGDLSQSLGAPVEKGQNLFEIAPLDSYRVTLQVDERDIGQLSLGQTGRLALVGLPDRHLAFRLERITPIAKQADGRNFFTVEAKLDENPPLLRPGMDGVGKIDIGERRLAWIWTHRLVDWLRLRAWSWLG